MTMSEKPLKSASFLRELYQGVKPHVTGRATRTTCQTATWMFRSSPSRAPATGMTTASPIKPIRAIGWWSFYLALCGDLRSLSTRVSRPDSARVASDTVTGASKHS